MLSLAAHAQTQPTAANLRGAAHPGTCAPAQRPGAALKEAVIPVRVPGIRDTDHSKLNNNLGVRAPIYFGVFIRLAPC